MQIEFKTLTPLYTGDRTTDHNRLRETGLNGSIRFWAGAIARGLGYEISGDKGDAIEIKSKGDIADLDPVTRIFGTTGWKKIFNMDILPGHQSIQQQGRLHVLAANSGWYLKPGLLLPWDQTLKFHYRFRKPLDQTLIGEGTAWIALTWLVIDRLAGIGAHQGWGYGQVRLANLSPIFEANKFKDRLGNLPKSSAQPSTSKKPDLVDFIFAEYEFDKEINLEPLGGKNSLFESNPNWSWENIPALLKPVGLSLRYLLHYGGQQYRPQLGSWGSDFWGGSKDNDPAGRFNGSFLFRVNDKGEPHPEGNKFRFRVWAWLPRWIFAGAGNGRQDWCSAAKLLRKALKSKKLWADVTNCKPPKECYFWPLTRSGAVNELQPLLPILEIIENRAINVLGRKCLNEDRGGKDAI